MYMFVISLLYNDVSRSSSCREAKPKGKYRWIISFQTADVDNTSHKAMGVGREGGGGGGKPACSTELTALEELLIHKKCLLSKLF